MFVHDQSFANNVVRDVVQFCLISCQENREQEGKIRSFDGIETIQFHQATKKYIPQAD